MLPRILQDKDIYVRFKIGPHILIAILVYNKILKQFHKHLLITLQVNLSQEPQVPWNILNDVLSPATEEKISR